jgi:hypothetical protein
MISAQTAMDIALAYREVQAGEKLLADVREAMDRVSSRDIRDAFGRPQNGLQLGVPSGENSHRMFNVPWALAVPVIETHIAAQRALINALCQQAEAEIAVARAEHN